MEKHGCFCVCKCVGCTALREAAANCDCATCQLLGFVPISENVPPEHRCIMECQCPTCKAIKEAAKKCDCLACVTFGTCENV